MDIRDLPEKSNLSRFMQPKKLINWDRNGIPTPFTDWLLPKNQVDNVILASMSLPYEGSWDAELQEYVLEPEYTGLTNIEVATIKQAKKAAGGDLESLRFIMERVLGKPKQSVEQTTLTMTLKEYLDGLQIDEVITVETVEADEVYDV